jgi:pyruvate/2-oxoglutarate dehydrogenase complex dihydrolipoamide dehydrogenase (E3) component
MDNGAEASVLTPDLCVIGGGLAGSSVALAAAALGLACVVVDKQAHLGRGQAGDLALETLIAAAHAASPSGDPAQNQAAFQEIRDRIGRAIHTAAPNHSAERLRSLGVTVLRATGRFTAPDTVVAGAVSIKARRFVIATGARPALPKIEGLEIVRALTIDTIAGLIDLPTRLAIIGSAPLAYELAQAFRRLGSDVALIGTAKTPPIPDQELLAAVETAFIRDGIRLYPNSEVRQLRPNGSGVDILLGDTIPTAIGASHLLVAGGRRPFIENLGLDRARVLCFAGVPVTRHDFRTSNRRVFAMGDVAGSGFAAATLVPAQVGLILRAAFLRQPVRFRPASIPRVLRTDPALAYVGAGEAEARVSHRAIRVWRSAFAENERALSTGTVQGQVKIVATPRGQVLGAGIVGTRAEDLITPWILSIARGVKLGQMATLPMPQPSLSDASRRAALGSVAEKLRSPWVKRALELIKLLG